MRVANRHFDVRIGCFVFGFGLFAFQSVLFGLFRTFFIIGWKKNAVCVSFFARFLITADREIGPISLDASPFHQIGWAQPYCKKAFVRFRLLMLWYSIPFSAKEATQCRAKFSETRAIPGRTQPTAPNSEVGMSDLHRIQADYIPVHRGSRYAPPQRIPKGVRRGVGEG